MEGERALWGVYCFHRFAILSPTFDGYGFWYLETPLTQAQAEAITTRLNHRNARTLNYPVRFTARRLSERKVRPYGPR